VTAGRESGSRSRDSQQAERRVLLADWTISKTTCWTPDPLCGRESGEGGWVSTTTTTVPHQQQPCHWLETSAASVDQ